MRSCVCRHGLRATPFGASAANRPLDLESDLSRPRDSAMVVSVSRRSPRRGIGPGLLLLVGSLVASCDDDDHGCEPNEPCPCRGGHACVLDCRDTRNCIPICSSADICDVLCGEGCHYDCSNISSCRVSTGPQSSVRCASVATCEASVAGGSVVNCSNLTSCNVHCSGDCAVHCSAYSSCTVTCADGDVLDCPGERKVCGGAC